MEDLAGPIAIAIAVVIGLLADLQHRQHRPRVRAPRGVPLRSAAGRARARDRAAHPVRAAGREGRPPRALPRGAAADLHHEGQRPDQHRLPRLLEGLRPADDGHRGDRLHRRVQALAATTLRAVIGDIPLDDVLAKREEINHILRAKLDEVTERWGVKITSVEIREIVPPRDIQDAMNRQMSAERNRRAVITESEGTRQATINVAEGDKQSNILRAEGDRQSQILRAEGYANALQTIFGAASGIDEKTMALQYLEALKALAAGEGTNWIVPMELSELTRPISNAMRQSTATRRVRARSRRMIGGRPARHRPGRRPAARRLPRLRGGARLAAARPARGAPVPARCGGRARDAGRRRARLRVGPIHDRRRRQPRRAGSSPPARETTDRGGRAARLLRPSAPRAGRLRAVASASGTTCSSSTSAATGRATRAS